MTSDDEPTANVRASDAEREQVVQRLHGAVSEGRLTLSEFGERTEAAYGTRTRGDLERLLADLPEPVGGGAVVAAGAGSSATQTLGIGAVKRRGRWRLAVDGRIGVTVGAVKLDLCDAELAAPVVELACSVTVGTIKVWVPEGIRVEVAGHTGLGGRSVEENQLPPEVPAPTVRLRLDTGIGTVKVMRVKDSARRRQF